MGLVRFLGVKGTLIAGLVMVVAFVFMPQDSMQGYREL